MIHASILTNRTRESRPTCTTRLTHTHLRGDQTGYGSRDAMHAQLHLACCDACSTAPRLHRALHHLHHAGAYVYTRTKRR